MSTAGLAGKLSPREEDRYETVENAQDGLGNGSHTSAALTDTLGFGRGPWA